MYTVKQIADLLGKTKPTVQKVINENFIEADKIEKNKFRYYSYEKTVFIIRVIDPDFNFSKLPQNTEKSPKNTANKLTSTVMSSNINPSVKKITPSLRRTSNFSSSVSALLISGINAVPKAPSPRILRKIFGKIMANPH